MKKTTLRTVLLIGLMSLPMFALAQSTATEINQGFTTFGGVINTLTNTIVRSLATLFATAAMVAFFFGIVKYIIGIRNGDAGENQKGKTFMVWSLVALFVMFSVWGIVTYVQRIFGIQNNSTITIPDIRLQGSGGSTGGNNNASGALPTTPTPSGSGTGSGSGSGSGGSSSGGGSTSACMTITNPDRQLECLEREKTTCGPNEAMGANGCYPVNGLD